MAKLELSVEHFDIGMRNRIASAVAKEGEFRDEVLKKLIHDGAVVKLEVVVPTPKKKEAPKKSIKKKVEKVIKKVKKTTKKKK